MVGDHPKIRIGQRWKARNNGNVLVVWQKAGGRWKLVRMGGRGKVHTMTENTIYRWYDLINL